MRKRTLLKKDTWFLFDETVDLLKDQFTSFNAVFGDSDSKFIKRYFAQSMRNVFIPIKNNLDQEEEE